MPSELEKMTILYENDARIPYEQSLRNFRKVRPVLEAIGVEVREEVIGENSAKVYGLYDRAEIELIVDNTLPQWLSPESPKVAQDKTHINLIWLFGRKMEKEEKEGRFWPLLGVYREVERVLGGK